MKMKIDLFQHGSSIKRYSNFHHGNFTKEREKSRRFIANTKEFAYRFLSNYSNIFFSSFFCTMTQRGARYCEIYLIDICLN